MVKEKDLLPEYPERRDMRITTLVENTPGSGCCGSEHGLSFYIETKKHRILMDAGASPLFAENAEKLGADLAGVDLAVLSHGHFDHAGGLMTFAKIAPQAPIYLQEDAFGGYYAWRPDGDPYYIGVDPKIAALPQVVRVGKELALDEELTIFADISLDLPIPPGNRALLVKKESGWEQDDFRHEQCLRILQGGKSFLFSGCAHHGILNVLESWRRRFADEPDYVFSGFHMMQPEFSDADIARIEETARALMKTKTVFYTGHCTGQIPFDAMKRLMGDQLRYTHSGDVVELA